MAPGTARHAAKEWFCVWCGFFCFLVYLCFLVTRLDFLYVSFTHQKQEIGIDISGRCAGKISDRSRGEQIERQHSFVYFRLGDGEAHGRADVFICFGCGTYNTSGVFEVTQCIKNLISSRQIGNSEMLVDLR